jgi:hypothetical protein
MSYNFSHKVGETDCQLEFSDSLQYKHPVKKGLVTISGNLNDDVASGTLSSMLKQAGLKGR